MSESKSIFWGIPDFLTANIFLVDFIEMHIAPAFAFYMMKYQPGFVTDDLHSSAVE